MNVFKINTTAYEEESFYLLTSLTEKEIVKVIKPIVQAEREDDENFYDNDMLANALKKAYPSATVVMYQEIDEITI